MSNDKVLADILRAFINDELNWVGYHENPTETILVLDGMVEVTTEQLEALNRIEEVEQGE